MALASGKEHNGIRKVLPLPQPTKGLVLDVIPELAEVGALVACTGFLEIDGMLKKESAPPASGLVLDYLRSRTAVQVANCCSSVMEHAESGTTGTKGEVEGGSGGGW